MMVSFVLSFFPRDVLDEILNLIESVSEDFPSYSFILEVDLEYPEDLHNAHNAYPLAPERMVVQNKLMSEYLQLFTSLGMRLTKVHREVRFN